uniref:CPG4 domain-containing protein n=1 Tax=Rhabditophanes sp. KR3021 TaxID=114890 RepID=A0AC35TJX7_9BILA
MTNFTLLLSILIGAPLLITNLPVNQKYLETDLRFLDSLKDFKLDNLIKSFSSQNFGNIENFKFDKFLNGFSKQDCFTTCLLPNQAQTDGIFKSIVTYKFDSSTMCHEFRTMERCLARNYECRTDIAANALITSSKFICDKDMFKSTGTDDLGLLCITRKSGEFINTCSTNCDLTKMFTDVIRVNKHLRTLDIEKKSTEESISDSDMCKSSSCFVECMKKEIETHCHHSTSKVLGDIVNKYSELTAKPLPFDNAIANILKSVLPAQCLPKNHITFTKDPDHNPNYNHDNIRNTLPSSVGTTF